MDEGWKMDETLKRFYKFEDIYGYENFVVSLDFSFAPSCYWTLFHELQLSQII